MNNIYADLHMHTLCSDGHLTTEQLAQKAKYSGLSVISITDHDTILAYSQLPSGVNYISGTELTLMFGSRSIHMLAYGFDLSNKELNEYLLRIKDQRLSRAETIVNYLNEQGLEINLDAVIKDANSEVITRSHIAAYMVKSELVPNNWIAFGKYLNDNLLKDLPKMNVHSTEKGIELIRNAGGFCSLAHPGKHYTSTEIYQLIKEGMRGIEVYHPSNGKAATRRHTTSARQYQLKITGGSDYHGRHDGEEFNFTHFGLDENQFKALGLEVQKSA